MLEVLRKNKDLIIVSLAVIIVIIMLLCISEIATSRLYLN